MLRTLVIGTLSGVKIKNLRLSAGLGLGFLMAFASVSSAGAQEGGGVEPSLSITVRVYNYAGASRGTLLGAEEEGSRIFRKAGVELVWLDCPTSHAEEEKYPACAPLLGAMALDLRILPPSMAARIQSGREQLGFALTSTKSGSASAAWIFYQRVEDLAESKVANQAQILAHAIAHEVGHLLLGPAKHSAQGIVRGNWDRRDLQEASQGQLFFTRDQAERIRIEVRTRSQMVEEIVTRQPAPRELAAITGR